MNAVVPIEAAHRGGWAMSIFDDIEVMAAKAKGVGIIAYLNAERLGLGPNQCAAAMRRARELYESRRASPAKAVSLVRRESYELSTSGAA